MIEDKQAIRFRPVLGAIWLERERETISQYKNSVICVSMWNKYQYYLFIFGRILSHRFSAFFQLQRWRRLLLRLLLLLLLWLLIGISYNYVQFQTSGVEKAAIEKNHCTIRLCECMFDISSRMLAQLHSYVYSISKTISQQQQQFAAKQTHSLAPSLALSFSITIWLLFVFFFILFYYKNFAK